MTDSFATHAAAARALIASDADLRPREGQFLGGIIYTDTLTDKQRNWLVILLDRHGLPPLGDGA